MEKAAGDSGGNEVEAELVGNGGAKKTSRSPSDVGVDAVTTAVAKGSTSSENGQGMHTISNHSHN